MCSRQVLQFEKCSCTVRNMKKQAVVSLRPGSDTVYTPVRIPKEIRERLDRAAKDKHLSVSRVIVQILEATVIR